MFAADVRSSLSTILAYGVSERTSHFDRNDMIASVDVEPNRFVFAHIDLSHLATPVRQGPQRTTSDCSKTACIAPAGCRSYDGWEAPMGPIRLRHSLQAESMS